MQKMGNVTQDHESGILPFVRQASDVATRDRRRRRRGDHRPARGPQRHRLRDHRRARRRRSTRSPIRTRRCSCCGAAGTARSSRAATSRSWAPIRTHEAAVAMASRVRRVARPGRRLPRARHRGAQRARARRRSRGRRRGRHPHRGRRRQDRLQPGDARHHAGVGRRGAARPGGRAEPRAPGHRDRRALRRARPRSAWASSTSSSRAPRSTTSGGRSRVGWRRRRRARRAP